ncbi:dipeptide ABC transporter ATP-binding protein [Spiribacter halobius]|uniref:ABC-type dipeptide transporter n=1 Tax=Sediminicurvatus halobius TaxID=2182432 RepID=A0A2U2N936_9GAMM|nr:ABC transporter ATP-binding protein [Spiribacter halobius]PWG65499.1 glutathione ABC transporter ATP-binding protein [Spiribacter halobius]UEX76523.1 ABC transporter ATP-binding protein [Spiribacter halobius]
MSAPVLELAGLSLSYRRRGRWHAAVRGLSLQVAPGEAVGLVGESGCGKSTVAMAALGYLPGNARIDQGAVRVAGVDLAGLSPAALRRLRGGTVAAVYQSPGAALNPSLTVGEQVAEVYRLHGGLDGGAARAAAGRMLARVRIPDPERLLAAYPYQLSGGMQQRVVIAMALAGDPRLLILDEPTTALDATVQGEILALFATLRVELRVALLFISHDLGVVRTVCDRVGVMYAGELVEVGSAQALFQQPAHPYTASLIDCIPDFRHRWEDARLAAIPGLPPGLGEQPRGCAFAPRCPVARSVCEERPIPLAAVADGRMSRCLFPEQTAPPGGNRRPATITPRAPGAETLAVEGLAVDYGRVRILDGVSLQVREGETLALVGESGSGKTTLARAVTGLTPPSNGAVRLHGRRLPARSGQRDQAARQRLQMVFQSPDGTLNPSHRVGATLRRALRVLGGVRGAEAGRRLQALLDAVALEPDTLRRRPEQLSGGQRQRVAIARAFTGTPALVILDEPTSALDVSVQAAILDLLIDLQQRDGTAYLFISHDLAVVRYLADRVAVLYLGQVVEEGAVAEVFQGRCHPYTEALLAAVPGSPHGAGAPPAGGDNPGPAARPPGCPFHTRCPYAMPACQDQAPPLREPVPGHRIRCHLSVDELPGANA